MLCRLPLLLQYIPPTPVTKVSNRPSFWSSWCDEAGRVGHAFQRSLHASEDGLGLGVCSCYVRNMGVARVRPIRAAGPVWRAFEPRKWGKFSAAGASPKAGKVSTQGMFVSRRPSGRVRREFKRGVHELPRRQTRRLCAPERSARRLRAHCQNTGWLRAADETNIRTHYFVTRIAASPHTGGLDL